jgi:YVTN family beta-propeller protein
VFDTVVLGNGTNEPGNFYASSGDDPSAIAYDPTYQFLYILTSNASTGNQNLEVWNVTEGREVTTISTGTYVPGLLVDLADQRLYLLDEETANVTAYNAKSLAVIGSYAVGSNPYSLALDPHNDYLYVVNLISSNVTVLDAANGAQEGSFPVQSSPEGAAYDPLLGTAGSILVAGYGSVSYEPYTVWPGNLTVFDVAKGHDVANVSVGYAALGVVYDPVNDLVLVGNELADNLTALDASTLGGHVSIALNFSPQENDINVSTSGDIYVVGNPSNLSVLDGANLALPPENFTVGSFPGGVAYDPTTGDEYVANSDSNNLTVLNDGTSPPTIVGNILLGPEPEAIAYSALHDEYFVGSGTDVFVVNASTHYESDIVSLPFSAYSLLALDSANQLWVSGSATGARDNGSTEAFTVTAFGTVVPIAGSEQDRSGYGALAYDATDQQVFLTDSNGSLVGIDPSTYLADDWLSLPSSYGPYTPAPTDVYWYAPTDGLYIPDGQANQDVTVVQITGVSGAPPALAIGTEVPAAYDPTNIALDTANGLLYVTDTGNGNLTVLNPDGNTSSAGALVSNPNGIAFDPSNGFLYVADTSVGNVSVINPTSGVAAGPNLTVGSEPWSVVYASNEANISVTNSGQGTLSLLGESGPAPPAYAVTLDSDPSGCPVQLGGTLHLTPFVANGVPAGAYSLEAAATCSVGGSDYAFSDWSASGSVSVPGGSGASTDLQVSGAGTVTADYLSVSSLASTPSASVNPVDEGEPTMISAGASGGSGSYSYSWSGLPSDCSAPGDVASFPCVPGTGASAGSPYSVEVLVTDTETSQQVTGSLSLTVDPALVVGPVTISPDPTQAGGEVTISTTGVSGGSDSYGPYVWSGLPSSCPNPGDVASFSCTPSGSGVWSITVNVTDSNGELSQSGQSLVVDPALEALLTPATGSTQVGASYPLGLEFYGGVPTVRWTLAVNGSTANLTTVDLDTLTYGFSPVGPGSYTFYLNATDAVGSVSDATASVTVQPALQATLSASATTTAVGYPVTLTLGFSGGVSPIDWTLAVNGSTANLTTVDLDTLTYGFSPVGPGSYTFYLNATDAVGSASDAAVSVQVNSGASASATLSADPTTTQVGAASVLTLGFSGTGPGLTWTLTVNGSSTNLSGVSGNSYTFLPQGAGTYTFTLTVADGGAGASATAVVTVEPALQASLSPVPGTTEVGVPSDLALGFSGGVSPVRWTLAVNGSTRNLSGVVADAYSFVPVAPGVYEFYLNATDAVGSVSKVAVLVTVAPRLVATLTVSSTPIDVGGSSSVSVGVTGGVGSVTWTLTENGSTQNLSSVVDGTYPFAPVGPGSYSFYLNATDSLGVASRLSVEVEVDPELSAGVTSATVDPVVAGTGTTISTSGASGGSGPGTYTYDWTGLPAGCTLPGDVPSFLCTPSPSVSGSFTVTLTVEDANGGIAVSTFTLYVTSSAPTYAVTFHEVGLTTGTWYVNVTGEPSSSATAGTAIVVDLPSGSYAYTAATTEKIDRALGGTFTVSGAPTTVTVTFRPVTFSVTFSETGLGRGLAWSVRLGGGLGSAVSPGSVGFSVTNGTYGYTVRAPAGFAAQPASGTVRVDGAAVTVSVTFSALVSVLVLANGLPWFTSWTIHLSNGLVASSTSPLIVLSLPAGSYTYTVTCSNPAYTAPPGAFTVHATPVTLSITFSHPSIPPFGAAAPSVAAAVEAGPPPD